MQMFRAIIMGINLCLYTIVMCSFLRLFDPKFDSSIHDELLFIRTAYFIKSITY